MSIKKLNTIADLELELRLINADIRKYNRDIQADHDYISYLKERFCTPTSTINKYHNKIKLKTAFLETLRKDRWFLKKELVMWEQGYEY